jgi:hypothetical protein
MTYKADKIWNNLNNMEKALQATYFNKLYTDSNPNHFLYLSGSQIKYKYHKVALDCKQYRFKYSLPPA